jgi:hypothetical protein
MPALRYFFTAVLLSHASGALAAGGDKQVRATFRNEYEPHAMQQVNFYTNTRLKFKTTRENPGGTGFIILGEGKLHGNSYLLDVTTNTLEKSKNGQDTNATRIIEGRNPRYQFTLAPKEENAYLLTELTIPDSAKPSAMCFLTFPFADYRYSKQPFLDMAKDETVEFLDLQECTWEKRSAKKLRVRLSARYGTGKGKSFELNVNFYFSPADRWICYGSECCETKKTSLIRREIYYYATDEEKSHPIPTRIEEWVIELDNPKNSRRMSFTEINAFENVRPFHVTEFTLSAFGLPEPEGIVWEKPIRWYLWFIGAAVVSLVIGWYFFRRMKKPTISPAPKSAT